MCLPIRTLQGRPFREGIRENSALYWGLVGASAVAFSGATDFVPEFSRWLQIVEMQTFVCVLSFCLPYEHLFPELSLFLFNSLKYA